MVDAAILAGGQARRLAGRDKARLLVAGTRVFDRQLAALAPLAARVLLVARDPERYADLGVPVYADLLAGGALAGIYTALTVSQCDRVIVIACDMPFLTAGFLQYLVDVSATVDATVPRTAAGYQPLCAVYARGCAALIRRRIEEGALQVQALFETVRTRVVGPEEIAPYDPDGMLFFNVNTPADHARACEYARRQESGRNGSADPSTLSGSS